MPNLALISVSGACSGSAVNTGEGGACVPHGHPAALSSPGRTSSVQS